MKLLMILLLSTGVFAKHSEYCVDVNLMSDSGKRSLDTCIFIDTNMKDYIVKHNMITLFSARTMEELQSKKGKEKVLLQLEVLTGATKQIYISKFKINY